MSAFLTDRQPSLTQLASVQATLLLDQPAGHLYTNLDVISGKVVVRCAKDIAVTGINVKLEGESRTRLLGQTREERRQDPNAQLELHKILYKVQSVFPPAEVAESREHAGKAVFTIPAGTHEYKWSFKLPFNNACFTPSTVLPGMQMGVSARGFEVSKIATRHIKTTLPPTLRGFPGEAEISYFVKATVQRQGFFKENRRSHAPFQFMPIEAPRPPLTGELSYARQQHTFYYNSKRTAKKSIFSYAAPTQEEGPCFSLDMRLPDPAILSCSQPLPLSIVVTKLNASIGVVYMQSLQISLIAATKIRTHDLERVEQTATIIMSKSNMGITAVNGTDSIGHQVAIDDSSWRTTPLPNTVCPTFVSCNISRSYQVEVRAGFAYGGATQDGSKVWKRKDNLAIPQHIVLALRLNASIYSGIAPPQEALERMTRQDASAVAAQQPASEKPAIIFNDNKTTVETAQSSSHVQGSAEPPPPLPTRYGEHPEDMEPPPPSYEDAIASDLPPVDGYRPAYVPPPAVADALLHRDEKRGWLR